MTTKKNSLLFKVTLDDEKKEFQINDFIDFFLEGGLFESYLSEIYGIATHNFTLNIFNVTFKESTPKSLIEDLYETFKIPQQITIKDEVDCLTLFILNSNKIHLNTQTIHSHIIFYFIFFYFIFLFLSLYLSS